jgi:methylated-DNA-[protein]-cysteine S-methyltransferase
MTTELRSTRIVGFPAPLGPLRLAATAAGLCRVWFLDPEHEADTDHQAGPVTGAGGPSADAHLDLAVRELTAYAAGELATFTVPVDLAAVPARERPVLEALLAVGHGATTTYGALAAQAGLGPQGARLVGGTMARNPVAVVVPCHRVVGADGSLTGYAGGLDRKRALLDLEARDTVGAQLTLS